MSIDRIEPKAVASGIPVYCAFDELVDIDALIPNPRNPNRHPDKQIELLAKIIKTQGWRAPITVSTRSGFIVRGHARLQASRLLGVSEVPVDYQDYENEASEWADLVADNRIAELATRDNDLLVDLLKDLPSDFDWEITGFTGEEIDRLIVDWGNVEFPEYDESIANDPELQWVPLKEIFGTDKVPQDVAELLKAEVERISSYVGLTEKNRWQTLKYMCANSAKTPLGEKL
ncbi:MAG TPA: ParB N-terminal domain-containing protein [Firmicutes bacterium]|nr:ParB N-terminal domain-containing protein [Bacillota bacterium]